MSRGIIFNIEEFGVHDGPGIRKIVFFKGCNLECNWCHNPEGISFKKEDIRTKDGRTITCGQEYDARELAEYLKKGADVLENSGGGITISGGEPLAQPEFLFELMDALKPLHIVVETAGHGTSVDFRKMMDMADIVFMDIKHIDPFVHYKFTGSLNNLILENVRCLCDGDRDFVIRIPLIPGVNDSKENMENTAKLISGAKHLLRVELLPYHKTAGAKYAMVNRTYQPKFDVNRKIEIHKDIFIRYKVPVEVL
jgi:pyruvate formate lyase activating enzyme